MGMLEKGKGQRRPLCLAVPCAAALACAVAVVAWAGGAARVQAASPSEQPASGSILVDGFEAEAADWQVFFDGHSQSQLTCTVESGIAHSGVGALRVDYDITADGWASCGLVYPAPQDWSIGAGLELYLNAPTAGQPLTVTVYGGESPEAPLHYEVHLETGQEAASGWQRFYITWDQFAPVSWAADPAAHFDAAQALGVAFSFDPETSGWLRVDDIAAVDPAATLAPGPTAVAPTPVTPAQEPSPTAPASPGSPTPEPTEAGPPLPGAPTLVPTQLPAASSSAGSDSGGTGLCPGAAALVFVVAAVAAARPRAWRAKH
jgi:hypothetical protein